MANLFKRIVSGTGPWFHKKIVDPFLQILRRGAEPKQLAFSASLGICLGVFPICGVPCFGTSFAKFYSLGYRRLVHNEFQYGARKLEVIKGTVQYKALLNAVVFSWIWTISPVIVYILAVFATKWVSVFLCGIAIAVLGSICHAPTVMLANIIATPIELSLMVPFLRLGEIISGGPHFPLTSDALKRVLTGHASWEIVQSILHALLGWLVAVPFILAALHVLLLPCFKILVSKFSTVPSSPKKPLSSHTEVRFKVRDA